MLEGGGVNVVAMHRFWKSHLVIKNNTDFRKLVARRLAHLYRSGAKTSRPYWVSLAYNVDFVSNSTERAWGANTVQVHCTGIIALSCTASPASMNMAGPSAPLRCKKHILTLLSCSPIFCVCKIRTGCLHDNQVTCNDLKWLFLVSFIKVDFAIGVFRWLVYKKTENHVCWTGTIVCYAAFIYTASQKYWPLLSNITPVWVFTIQLGLDFDWISHSLTCSPQKIHSNTVL